MSEPTLGDISDQRMAMLLSNVAGRVVMSKGIPLPEFGGRLAAPSDVLMEAAGRFMAAGGNRDVALGLLSEARDLFREYERHHLLKDPADTAKAARNGAIAERIEALLASMGVESDEPLADPS